MARLEPQEDAAPDRHPTGEFLTRGSLLGCNGDLAVVLGVVPLQGKGLEADGHTVVGRRVPSTRTLNI